MTWTVGTLFMSMSKPCWITSRSRRSGKLWSEPWLKEPTTTAKMFGTQSMSIQPIGRTGWSTTGIRIRRTTPLVRQSRMAVWLGIFVMQSMFTRRQTMTNPAAMTLAAQMAVGALKQKLRDQGCRATDERMYGLRSAIGDYIREHPELIAKAEAMIETNPA